MPDQETSPKRREILGTPRDLLERELVLALAELRHSAYRARQATAWIYERRATSFDEMTDLPVPLRRALDERFSLAPLSRVFEVRSSDGTVKHLWRLRDGEQVESVLIPAGDRVTLCLSSQAGCALACRFCATGDFGFRRHLTSAEIVAQYRDSERISRRLFGRGVDNVVYMGMGAPLATRRAVDASRTVIHGGFGLGARRITVSTVGLIPGIRALARRAEPFRLAVSLHAPNHRLRLALVSAQLRAVAGPPRRAACGFTSGADWSS
jgi:23S rRNA (adenine2503-C2)-methyltransferase